MRRKESAGRGRAKRDEDLNGEVARWLAELEPLLRQLEALADTLEKRHLATAEPAGRA
ncbi:hypothetical protein sos41_01310 [Alphaproteobacteria bacterium SO-S41]|nr:hypothetical protein sos41_01310 [Alphaproteobacteria bacterium SO-S41]